MVLRCWWLLLNIDEECYSSMVAINGIGAVNTDGVLDIGQSAIRSNEVRATRAITVSIGIGQFTQFGLFHFQLILINSFSIDFVHSSARKSPCQRIGDQKTIINPFPANERIVSVVLSLSLYNDTTKLPRSCESVFYRDAKYCYFHILTFCREAEISLRREV